MYNVFQLADNDQSLTFLGQIFGNVGGALAGTGPVLLPTMFKVFNTTLLVIGCLFVAYITVLGVMNTAQEGEFLGKKWSKLWMPIRTVMGIVALFPTAGGYCVMQVIVMWIVVQGVGAADMVWKTTVDYFALGGRQSVAPPTPSDLSGLAPDLTRNIFNSLVCQSAAYKLLKQDVGAVAHTSYDNWGSFKFDANGALPGGQITA